MLIPKMSILTGFENKKKYLIYIFLAGKQY